VVGRTGGVDGQISADTLVKVISAFDDEVLVVLVEVYGELVEETLCAENTLK
jgi:hypothetical protein